MALSICAKGGRIFHLIIVPTLWQGMTGDDWLNNGHTRDQFSRYLETQLGKEINSHCERIAQQARQHELSYTKKMVLGKLDQSLISYSKTRPFDLVIIGSPRPKGIPGLRSRMLTKNLPCALNIPLLIAPYPQ